MYSLSRIDNFVKGVLRIFAKNAIARGQSVVFYDGDLLVGGGIIE